jgi:uncharacterized phage protein (TIGR01671 family)
MREIKFRVWNGVEWCYVNEFTLYDLEHQPNGYCFQQYTGLKYKNNQEIYEGDIFNTLSARWVVVFENGCFYAKACAGWNFEVKQQILLIDLIDSTHVPLGNIFENPELLES